jgi:hypothetical protein
MEIFFVGRTIIYCEKVVINNRYINFYSIDDNYINYSNYIMIIEKN